ncbi:MAG TPA: hypothetical protein VEJ37_04530, partial [Xanthobacteraceae bacterium]|nr:hypothetical protein [Xanthobacteraceae bacterium]
MSEALAARDASLPGIDLRYLIWVALALLALIVTIIADNIWALNFLHVMCGVMWTGIDLFMGFVVGPIIRRLPLEARRAIVVRLLPKTLFLMPTLAIVTGTAGWYHARQLGFLDLPWPQYGWVLAALVIVVILTVQGIGVLLPTNLLAYLEMRKLTPDLSRISRLMSRYVYATA